MTALSCAAKEISEHHVKAKGGIPFCARGIGLDNCPGCYVCGGLPGLRTNISGFVRRKEDGEKVVEMFTSGAWMDFRPSEPQRIQVKIGACDAHRLNLEALMKATRDGGISKSDVDASLRIENVALAGA